jgi:8-oxo-dGTP pyrophosphatase MutT (NUDIX family)
MEIFIKALKEQLQSPLPGWKAQKKMASLSHPENRDILDFEVPDTWKTAAVLCLLVPKDNEWHIALMKRSANKHDKHSGQISFPGGKHENNDPDYKFTALRETEEEFGIPTDQIEILGKLTALPVPASNFLVYPYVGYCKTIPDFILEKAEVASIVQPSISHLLDPANLKVKDWSNPSGWSMKNVPYFEVENHVVWGATAMMLAEFLEIVRAAKETL